MGNHEAVRKLLRCGANLGLKNWKGETPIVHIAPTIIPRGLGRPEPNLCLGALDACAGC